jgi:hypothetical protein
LDLDAPVGRILKGGPMTKRKIAGWIMLPVVYAAFFGVLALVLEAQEEQEMAVYRRDTPPLVTPASELELACAELPSWRPYSTLPLTYHPPCGFGEMVPTRAARPTQAAHHTHAHSNGSSDFES